MTGWRLTLPCTKAEAEALAADILPLAALDPPPTLMTSEADPSRPEAWRLDAYFECEPDADSIALLRGLLPSAARAEPDLQPLPDEDWVALSQAGLEPIRAGRFLVHTPAHRPDRLDGRIAFEIDAGQAFGTGHHATTAGCLDALTRLADGGATFRNVVDVGTGTGLLAFAARALWPDARVVASDNDPIAVAVADENARLNGVERVDLFVAEGLEHPDLQARAPYELLIANILAGPLIELAPAFAAALAPNGHVLLAGLLDRQADEVSAAYERLGIREQHRTLIEGWAIVLLTRERGGAA